MQYNPGTIRLNVLAQDPYKAKNWPFPLTRNDKAYLLETWADAGTYADLDSATDADIEQLWQLRLEITV